MEHKVELDMMNCRQLLNLVSKVGINSCHIKGCLKAFASSVIRFLIHFLLETGQFVMKLVPHISIDTGERRFGKKCGKVPSLSL